jgi:hypothetical protein
MITFVLVEGDYQAAQRLHYRRSKTWRWLALHSAVLLGVAAFLAFGPYQSAAIRGWTWLIPTLVAWLWVVALSSRYLVMPRRLHRMFSESRMLRQPRSYSWDEAALTTQSGAGTDIIPWGDFLKSDADEQVFLLYTTPRQFLCIPRRAFAGAEHAEAFGRLIRSRIGAGAVEKIPVV